MVQFLISLFTEKKCFSCYKLGRFFCLECNKTMVKYEPYCYICKWKSDNFYVHNDCQKHFPLKQVIVLTRYRNRGVQKLLKSAKYYNMYPAYRDIIYANIDFFKKYVHKQNALLIPVPMYFIRRWKRWYNQSEKIAQNLSEVCWIPVNNKFLMRSRHTKQQSHLSQNERAQNLSWVFKTQNESTVDKNSTIYLIDDVISTGSTVWEIALYLHKCGYKNIRAIVLASD